MEELILSRVLDTVNNREYYIGTVGAIENVTVNLLGADSYTGLKVIVQNLSITNPEEAVNEYELSEHGQCKFKIPMGNTYEIILPVIGNYKQPYPIRLTAQLASRSVMYEYKEQELFEQINISAQVVNGSISLIEGLPVVAQCESGNTYSSNYVNGKAMLRIPYGERYKLNLPDAPEEGWIRDCLNIQLVAGLPSRDILVHYSEMLLGYFGIDKDGNQYSIEQIEQMKENGADLNIIEYIGYNDPTLAVADRGDGTVGCGFMFPIPAIISAHAWSSSNVEFNDPDTEEADLPFVSNLHDASKDCASSVNTTKIINIGEKIGIPTPAASFCRSQTITVGGVERRGNLIAFGAIFRAYQNRANLQELLSLLDKTGFSIWNTSLYTSCQASSTTCITLYAGGILGVNKTTNINVLVTFDL